MPSRKNPLKSQNHETPGAEFVAKKYCARIFCCSISMDLCRLCLPDGPLIRMDSRQKIDKTNIQFHSEIYMVLTYNFLPLYFVVTLDFLIT